MSGSDDSGDKTEKPTPKKLQDARKKGDISKSKDVTSTAGLLVLLALAAMALPLVGGRLSALVDASFAVVHEPFSAAAPRLGYMALQTLLVLVGLVAMPVAIVGVLIEFLQAGPVLTIEKLKPKMENMNPAKGFKRIFSMDNLVEFVKSILKTAVVGVIAWLSMKTILPQLPELVHGGARSIGSALWNASWTLVAWAVGSFVLVSAMDAAWQRYSFMKKMRMSMRDIRQEVKDAEGDPHVKQQRMQIQHEWAQQGASQAAANAHVLVVNPTHVAIAIDYDRERCPVPTVIAKGEDDDALAMRRAAAESGVPVLRNVKLARQLLADVETGDIVPAELFDIIATIILWAQDVRRELKAIASGLISPPSEEQKSKRRTPPGEDLTDYGYRPHPAAETDEAQPGRRRKRPRPPMPKTA